MDCLLKIEIDGSMLGFGSIFFRIARLLTQRNPIASGVSPRVQRKPPKNPDYRRVETVLPTESIASVNFGALPRKVPGKKFTIATTK